MHKFALTLIAVAACVAVVIYTKDDKTTSYTDFLDQREAYLDQKIALLDFYLDQGHARGQSVTAARIALEDLYIAQLDVYRQNTPATQATLVAAWKVYQQEMAALDTQSFPPLVFAK